MKIAEREREEKKSTLNSRMRIMRMDELVFFWSIIPFASTTQRRVRLYWI